VERRNKRVLEAEGVYNMSECEHRHVKANFPHGKKSGSFKFCKKCGAVVSNKMIRDRINKEHPKRRKNGNN